MSTIEAESIIPQEVREIYYSATQRQEEINRQRQEKVHSLRHTMNALEPAMKAFAAGEGMTGGNAAAGALVGGGSAVAINASILIGAQIGGKTGAAAGSLGGPAGILAGTGIGALVGGIIGLGGGIAMGVGVYKSAREQKDERERREYEAMIEEDRRMNKEIFNQYLSSLSDPLTDECVGTDAVMIPGEPQVYNREVIVRWLERSHGRPPLNAEITISINDLVPANSNPESLNHAAIQFQDKLNARPQSARNPEATLIISHMIECAALESKRVNGGI